MFSQMFSYIINRFRRKETGDAITDANESNLDVSNSSCKPCQTKGIELTASYECIECKEVFCVSCSSVHKSMNATRNHSLREVHFYKHRATDCEQGTSSGKTSQEETLYYKRSALNQWSQTETKSLGIKRSKRFEEDDTSEHLTAKKAKEGNESKFVPPQVNKCVRCSCDKMCVDCKTVCCIKCAEVHNKQEGNENHTIVDIGRKMPDDNGSSEAKNEVQKTVEKTKPGKPTEIKAETRADSLKIRWKRPAVKFRYCKYQIRYQARQEGIWKSHVDQPDNETAVIQALKSDVEYIFQVRMVNNDKEGPYSEQSCIIKTTKSSAERMVELTTAVKMIGEDLSLRRIPLTEIRAARNKKWKTRKFECGSSTLSKLRDNERTIMLVGETGSGKSTLVDGIVNYVLGVNWTDRYRFTMVDLEDDEKASSSNQAVSQTRWITSYTINYAAGNRIDYRLNIIDTPGFGDTHGIERDQDIVKQITDLFSSKSKMGVQFLDAICFLTKSPDARLTPTQKYVFGAILSLFGQDIAENISLLITFADGKVPPVLAALDESDLPHDVFFPFNNSGLFAENSGSKMSQLSPFFWEMGLTSFKSFFDHLAQMNTKSLTQTKEVLTERRKLELTIENLQPMIDVGLNKLEALRAEKKILEQHKSDIEANKDFHYFVLETKQVKHDLENGIHVTNCINCHITCHKNCKIPKDEDKKRCWAMDQTGNCTQCSGKCFWSDHANTPYIFEYVQENVRKTYAEKLEKYRHASGEKMTHETVNQRMRHELYSLEEDVMAMMNNVHESNSVLRDIALRPNPLSIKEHIDILIKSEKLEKRTGFDQRIETLQIFRKKTLDNIGHDVARFQREVGDVRQTPRRVNEDAYYPQ